MTLKNMCDFELRRAALDCDGAAAGEDRRLLAGPVPDREGHPIADIEVLGLDPIVVESDHAVGQDAVDVGDQQLNWPAPLGDIKRLSKTHLQSLLEIRGNQSNQVCHVNQADQMPPSVDDWE